MTIDDFFAEWNNRYCKAPGGLGGQCVDLANQYLYEFLKTAEDHANAVDWFTNYDPDSFLQIANEPANYPIKGDLVIWSKALDPYGHIAICNTADMNQFQSFDQNWPIGSDCHFQGHNYIDVLGWLRFKAPVVPPNGTQPPQEGDDMTEDQKNALGVLQPLVDNQTYGNLEGAARSGVGAIADLKNAQGTIQADVNQINGLTEQVKTLQDQLTHVTPTPVPDLESYPTSQLFGAWLRKLLSKSK